MGPTTFFFILLTTVVACWFGFRWRAHKGARSTYRTAADQLEKAAKARRTALGAFLVACLGSVLYLLLTGYLSLHGLFGGPAGATTPSPTPKPPVHASAAPTARP